MTSIRISIAFLETQNCKVTKLRPFKFLTSLIFSVVLLVVLENFSCAFASHGASESSAKVKALFDRGQQLLSKAEYGNAELAFKQALMLTPPSKEQAIINLLNLIGVSLHGQNKEIESAFYLRKALAKLPSSSKNSDLRRAKILSNLALAYGSQGKHAEAQKCSEESISIFKSAKADPSELSVALNSFGRLRLNAGDVTKAESLFAESISIRQRINGPSSKDLVSPLINLSSALFQQGKFEQSETICKRAIDICARNGITEGVALFPLLCQLGQLEAAQHRYKQGLKSLEEARLIADQVIGRNSEEAFVVRLILSETYEKDGQPELAEKSLGQAADLAKFAWGSQHSRTIDTTLSLADLFERHGNSSEADKLRLFCRLSAKQ